MQTDRVFTDRDRVEEHFRFAGGQAVLFSARAPDFGRPNQDGAALVSFGAADGVLAVADGLGGQPGGASASDIALTHLKDWVASGAAQSGARGAILDGIEEANQAILDLGIGAGTTLSVAEISHGRLRPYHVGDSAIIVVGQRGRLKLQTLAHSPVGYALESGLLDEEQALRHEERHFVSNMVGSLDMRIEVGSSLALAPRDTALLATDGLLDNLSLAEIVEIIRCGPLRRAAATLAERCENRMREPAAGEPSKPDDATFILFRREI